MSISSIGSLIAAYGRGRHIAAGIGSGHAARPAGGANLASPGNTVGKDTAAGRECPLCVPGGHPDAENAEKTAIHLQTHNP